MHRKPFFWICLIMAALWFLEGDRPAEIPKQKAKGTVTSTRAEGASPAAPVTVARAPVSAERLPPGVSGAVWVGNVDQPTRKKSVFDTENLPRKIPADRHVEATFVIDVSGSMGWVFEDARNKALALLKALEDTRAEGFEVRAALVGYRDRRDSDMLEIHDMTGDWEALRRAFDGLDAHGGGLPGENVQAGLDAALHKVRWRGGDATTRIVYLIGDEPSEPHGELPTIERAAEEARSKGIVIHAINASHEMFPHHEKVERQWRGLATATGGEYEEVQPRIPKEAIDGLKKLGNALKNLFGRLSS